MSESQERGVIAIPPDKLTTALNILESYGVPTSIIGVFTWTSRCQVVYDDGFSFEQWVEKPHAPISEQTTAVNLPYSFLTAGCPLPLITTREPLTSPASFDHPVPQNETGWIELVARVLGHYNICDQSAAAHQYDQTVQGTTVQTYINGPGECMPDELFVKAPLFGKPYGVGIANSVNQFYGDIDPAMFGRLMLASAATKLVAAGFAPSDINFCANVYSPPATKDPEQAWRLEQLVKFGYGPGTVELGIPVTSGKDSSSGRFENEQTGEKTDAPLTLDILAVGRMPDVQKLIRKPFRKPGDFIMLYTPGLIEAKLGGSILYDLSGQRGDQLPSVNLRLLRKGLELYHSADQGRIYSRSAIAEGGVIRRLFECCLGSGLGCSIELGKIEHCLAWLFAELHGSILFTTNSRALWVSPDLYPLGMVTEQPAITVFSGNKQLFSAGVAKLSSMWSKTFKEVIA